MNIDMKERPSLQNLPFELRLKVYAYLFHGFSLSCNWDMQPAHCFGCSNTHDIMNVLRVSPAAGEDRRQYSLSMVSKKLRSETIPLIKELKYELLVVGPCLVIGAPPECKGLFDLPNRMVSTQSLRSLVLDRGLPQLPNFGQLSNLEMVIIPAPSTGAHKVSGHLPTDLEALKREIALKKSFMAQLSNYDFGNWAKRVWNAVRQNAPEHVKVAVRRTVLLTGNDENMKVVIDMELHKVPNGRLGPERILACSKFQGW